jgi:hypothetical protein
MTNAALIINGVATFTMIGIIWFVQHVHYPLLATFSTDVARSVALEHQRRTGHVVAVPMALEGVSTLVLLVQRPAGVWVVWPWIGAVLLAVALGSTVMLSVPRHARMADQPDPRIGHELVSTNWPRTIAWTLRGAICILMIVRTLEVT